MSESVHSSRREFRNEDQSCRARGARGRLLGGSSGDTGCATQGESMEELLRNVHEAIEGCLSVDVAEPKPDEKTRILEIAV